MATLTELHTLLTDPTLGDRVEMACIIVAEQIRGEDINTANHAYRLAWAKKVWQDSGGAKIPMLKALLGRYNALTTTQIQEALDPALITAVSDAANVFADGE